VIGLMRVFFRILKIMLAKSNPIPYYCTSIKQDGSNVKQPNNRISGREDKLQTPQTY
jgi:hypothetical protein